MVSNARLDLPEPESPVTTMSLSRGNSTDTFFKLCTRAPCTAIVVRAAGRVLAGCGLPGIGRLPDEEVRQFLHVDIAPLRQADRQRRFADESLIGEILTGSADERD